MKKRQSAFKHQVRDALKNENLQLALERATVAFSYLRKNSLAGYEFEGERDRIRKIKENALANIDYLLARFREKAELTKATVFEARDGVEAANYIREIAEKNNARLIVKSKSMATEEIELNPYLEKAGIKVVETDLGEYIIQLAGERPSHFLAPAMHKTREEVALLFSKITGEDVPADIQKLVKIARKQLRKDFIEADIGISGSNIAIADTGTLLIVTNEGNARLVTTLPRIHIAVLGFEKIVGDLEEATKTLQMLLRSAGVAMPSYVSFITGPSKTGDIELTPAWGVHGPEEVHIVILDNGRRRMLNDPEFREALYCLKCAACLSVCPVFQSVGGHIFGHIYSGGIGTVLTAFLHGLEHAAESLFLCIGCRACHEVCPVKIDTPRMLLALRQKLVEEEGLSWAKGLAFRKILKDRTLFHKTIRAAAVAQRSMLGQPLLRHLPLFFSSLTRLGSLPMIAKEPLRKRITKERSTRNVNGTPVYRVAFFSGCLIDFAYPENGEAVLRILNSQNVEVSFPQEQTCCGIPAIYSGDKETALELAFQNIEALEKEDVDFIITACPTCAAALREDLPKLTMNEDEWHGRSSALGKKVYDFSEFLHSVLKVGNIAGKNANMELTYHDPCHLKRRLGIFRHPRSLLTAQAYHIKEMPNSDSCCGFGGTFSLSFPEVSEKILSKKIAEIKSSGAKAVATDCPGCVMQLRNRLQQSKEDIKVMHTAEWLVRLLD